jgi:hypothetical protein
VPELPSQEGLEQSVAEEIADESDDLEQPARPIDPALVFIILAIITLLGLSRLEVEARYTVIWSMLTVIAIVAVLADRIEVEGPSFRELIIGIGFGVLIGAPVLGVGGIQLASFSATIFGQIHNPAIFQMLAFTMPIAEGLYFRVAIQSMRGPLFAGIAAGIWSMVLFFPQLNPKQDLPIPVLVVLGVCFVFVNFIYSYLRHRFGLFASWTCQITINLLLLFAARFMV